MVGGCVWDYQCGLMMVGKVESIVREANWSSVSGGGSHLDALRSSCDYDIVVETALWPIRSAQQCHPRGGCHSS